MADINALFEELGKLSPTEAKELSEQLKAKMPQSTPKADASPAEEASPAEPTEAE